MLPAGPPGPRLLRTVFYYLCSYNVRRKTDEDKTLGRIKNDGGEMRGPPSPPEVARLSIPNYV